HQARVLERHQDALQELLGDRLLLGDLVDLHQAPVIGLGQVGQGLEPVEAPVGDLHSIMSIGSLDYFGHRPAVKRNYTTITSTFWAFRPSSTSRDARASVMTLWTRARLAMTDRLRRRNVLESATTSTSRETRIMIALSWASSTSGVERPMAGSRPSTPRNSRSALRPRRVCSAWGPTSE